jgi:hypothetical protein
MGPILASSYFADARKIRFLWQLFRIVAFATFARLFPPESSRNRKQTGSNYAAAFGYSYFKALTLQ